MRTPTHQLSLAGTLALLLFASCTKVVPINPPPPLPYPIQSIEQTPLKTYTDSLFGLVSSGTILNILSVALNDNAKPGSAGEDIGQAEIGFAFRSSVAGAITSLGLKLPSTGYQHFVVLWDSLTGQVLAQANVPTLSGGNWTYVSLALADQAVPIEANRGYVLAFNSLANGNSIGVADPGNYIFLLDGIYTLGGGGPKLPIVPFTQGAITFEVSYLIFYDTPQGRPIFPPAGTNSTSTPFDVPGLCDVGFVPAP